MKKLELKHLSPYLPYGLKAEMLDCKIDYVGEKYNLIIGVHQWSKNGHWCALTEGGSKPSLDRVKPILRPLSDLTKEIEHKGEKFVPQSKMKHLDLEWLINSHDLIEKTNYEDVVLFFEWHFDVFGLIDEGLAIDINSLP